MKSTQYFAGLVDGDGSLGIWGTLIPRAEVTIAMTHSPTIQAFSEFFNTSMSELRSPSLLKNIEAGHAQRRWRAIARNYHAYEIAKQLAPFLLTKRYQAELIIEMYEDRHCAAIGCEKRIKPAFPRNRIFCSRYCANQAARVTGQKYTRQDVNPRLQAFRVRMLALNKTFE